MRFAAVFSFAFRFAAVVGGRWKCRTTALLGRMFVGWPGRQIGVEFTGTEGLVAGWPRG